MTTEREDVHYLGGQCGRAGILATWAGDRDRVTCPACLTAMGEPRAVSGTDAVAATADSDDETRERLHEQKMGRSSRIRRETEPREPGCQCHLEVGDSPCRVHGDEGAAPPPFKPTHIAVGQRRRYGTGPYTVISHYSGDYWLIRRDGSSLACQRGRHDIFADEYLGLVAPVETPAPTGAEKHEPVTTVRCRCPSCIESGATHCTAAPAAPAPGAGEGREMTFAEAMALDPGEVEWTCDTLESHAWSTLALYQHLPLNYLRRCRFRLKPEPLPAPAPRPSRVAELAGTWTMSGKDPQACVLDAVTRAVEETLEAAQAAPAGYRPSLTEAIARARAAMLEPRK